MYAIGKLRWILPLVLLSAGSYADEVAVSKWGYLNNNENSIIIDPTQAQDLLNVDVTPGGKSLKKRPGFGLYKTLSTSQALHGGYHFFDSTGNDVQLWGSSTSLKAIVADGAVTTIVSSATLNSTWDCTDIQGSAYCANSSRDGLIKTAGVSLTLWSAPNGTMVEATPDRLVVAGISGALNSLYVSASNSFNNFTPGVLTSDPFIEPIASPGSYLTHIRWACGKLLWWKNQSFGYTNFVDQYTLENKIVSDTIGTFDNTSAVDPGGAVWFRGQEGHIWKYDCSSLTKETIDITPNVQASGRRVSNAFVYTTQSDFQLGSSSPTNTLSTTINAGAVVPASFTVTENSGTQWSLGSASNLAVGTSSISLSVNNLGDVSDPSFESGSGATLGANWTASGAFTRQSSVASGCTLNPQAGSQFAYINDGSGNGLRFNVIVGTAGVAASAVILGTATTSFTGACTWTQATFTDATLKGRRVRFQFKTFGGSSPDAYLYTTETYIFGGSISFYYNTNITGIFSRAIDNVQLGSSTIASGNFASQAFNTGVPYSFVFASATWSADSTPVPSFVLQRSANGSTGWSDVPASSTGTNLQTNLPYLRYLSTFTITPTGNALSALTGIQLLSRSSGTYFSAVKNAPSIGAWSTFNPTWLDNGDDINFSIRSANTPFYALNSTPTWTVQPANSLVAAPVGTYFQVIASFTVTAATNTPSSLNDFTVNWYEGSAIDQAYMLYFDNAIWASVAYGTGVSSNTYIFRRDLINDGWGLYNFGASGMLVQNNHLFFGDTSTGGNIFQYGSGTSDNGAVINAFWKSKDFTGQDPFLDNQLNRIDTYAKTNQGQSLTATYTLNTSTPTSFNIALSSSTQTVIQNRKLLPSGKNAYSFSIKYGDISSMSAWEIFGFRIDYLPQPYRPTQ